MNPIILFAFFITVLMATSGCLKEPEVDFCGVIRLDQHKEDKTFYKLTLQCVPSNGDASYEMSGNKILGGTWLSPEDFGEIKAHHKDLHNEIEANAPQTLSSSSRE